MFRFCGRPSGRLDSRDDIPEGCPLPDGSGGADAYTANPTDSAAADPAMETVPSASIRTSSIRPAGIVPSVRVLKFWPKLNRGAT